MDFQKEVIEASANQPILVDFWAPWCGPCQFLGPVLEKVAREQDKWRLVKVNVDDHPEISQQFGIRGIPDVRLFVGGDVKAQFTGALPEHEIRKWLQEQIPDERLPVLEALVTNAKKGKDVLKLEAFVKDNPDLEIGRIALARIVLWENPISAGSLVEGFGPTHKLWQDGEAIATLSSFLRLKLDSKEKIGDLLCSAQKLLLAQDFDAALDHVIQAVMFDKHFEKELPRRLGVALFHFFGSGHELWNKYRRRFDMALY